MFFSIPKTETVPPFGKTRSLTTSIKISFWIFILLVVSLLLTGHLIYQRYIRIHRNQVEQQLSSIASLKIAELLHWRAERMGDAEMVRANFSLARSVHAFSKNSGDLTAKQDLQKWLMTYASHYDYNQVRIFDTKGITRMLYPPDLSPAPNEVLKQIPEAIRSKQIEFVDLYKDPYDHQIYLSVLVPLYASTLLNQVEGVLAMRVDPKKWLYPIILSWPTWGETGETLLIRRDGDEALFLSDTQGAENSPLQLRLPLTNSKIPASAAAHGHSGIMSGTDYNGTPVIADIHPIPGTPWFLEVKMSTREADLPMKPYLFGLAGLISSLIIGLTVTFVFLWRKQGAEFYRREAEAIELIKESEAKLRAVFECSMDAIAISKAGIHLLANPAYLKLFGFNDNEDILGTSVINSIAPSHRSGLHENIKRRANRIPTPARYESKGLRSEGNEFDMEVSVSTFELRSEVYSVASFRDISDRKNHQEQLLAGKLAAEQTLEIKSRFLDLAAHEFRNPVTVISLFLQLAKKQAEKGQTPDTSIFTRLQEPVNRLTRLIVDLLDVSRLERDQLTIEPERTNIVALVSTCIEEFQLQFPNRHFNFIKPENSIEIILDPLRVNQVLTNLLDNATKYTLDHSPIEIAVEAKADTIRITVSDQGQGISKEQLPELFVPFIRGRSDKVIRTSGLGLGLALCSKIVKLHGGTIDVHSEDGRGSTFYFELPIIPIHYS